jgi:hypothetical protein
MFTPEEDFTACTKQNPLSKLRAGCALLRQEPEFRSYLVTSFADTTRPLSHFLVITLAFPPGEMPKK